MKKIDSVAEEPGGRGKVFELFYKKDKFLRPEVIDKNVLRIFLQLTRQRRIEKYGPSTKKIIKKIEIGSCLPKSMVRYDSYGMSQITFNRHHSKFPSKT